MGFKWEFCEGGSRIILVRNPDVVNLMVVNQEEQVLHCMVTSALNDIQFFVSFIYANNDYMTRRLLWNDLIMHKRFVGTHPWVIMGDFNASLSLEDCYMVSSRITTAMCEFKDCVDSIEVMDVNQTGMRFTWNQRPNADTGILKKIDRVMANEAFVSMFPNCYVDFKPYRISDHCPAVLKIPQQERVKPKPFKFSNYLVHKSGFKMVVQEGWSNEVTGHKMFRVVKKLRFLKKPLRKIMWSNGNLHARVVQLRQDLDAAQIALDANPHSNDLRADESHLLKAFNDALLDEERFLKQKSKIEWLRVGDCNSSYFYKVIKGKTNMNRIQSVEGVHGGIVEGRHVAERFVQHYQDFLGSVSFVVPITDPSTLFLNKIDPEKAWFMV